MDSAFNREGVPCGLDCVRNLNSGNVGKVLRNRHPSSGCQNCIPNRERKEKS